MATNIDEQDWLNFLETGNTIPKDKANNNCICEWTGIEEIYKKAKELGIKTSPLDIRSVVERLFNIKVYEADLDRNISGFIERISGQEWAIYLNQWESKLRQNFTIAHELGHFIKHRDILLSGSHIDQVLFRDTENSDVEMEASEYAANLLMPKHKFDEYIKNGITNIEELSKKFGVSSAAIRYRAYKLKYISEY